MIVITRLTVAQMATVTNALVATVHYTIGMALVAIFIRVLPPINSANTWSAIAKTIHSSYWHTIIRPGTTSRGEKGLIISLFSYFFLLTTSLVTITGMVTPLGLQDGPLLQGVAELLPAQYIPDFSPVALATSPRNGYAFSRFCGGPDIVPCPGYPTVTNTSDIAPKTIETFSSTPHGPFNIQFRQYYNGTGGFNYSMLISTLATLQPFILEDGLFPVEGLIVDMGENPGIGFWNHTLPSVEHGGSWSEEVLWLEPVSACVNTNLTFDYTISNNTLIPTEVKMTDRGGFAHLPTSYTIALGPQARQDVDIYERAYTGAALSNFATMLTLKTTSNSSFVGRQFPLNDLSDTSLYPMGQMKPVKLDYLEAVNNTNTFSAATVSCALYTESDPANMDYAGVHCGLFLGPPARTDGDPRIPANNSTWAQTLHSCASVTRARLQDVTFSFNGTNSLSNLRVERRNTDTPTLWATEKSDLLVSDVNLYWGRVADQYENDPSLTTVRSETFYLPASRSDLQGNIAPGQPDSVPAATWSTLYSSQWAETFPDYTGKNNFAILHKLQTILAHDPNGGSALIRNLMWTDIVANNLVGSATSTSLFVQPYKKTIAFDLKYGIPAAILLTLWAFSVLTAIGMFASGSLRISDIRDMMSHTSVGRVIMGDSAFRILSEPAKAGGGDGNNANDGSWAKTVGKTPVAFGSQHIYEATGE